jgi:hypothetical protein
MKPIFDELIATGVVDWALRRDMKGDRARENLLQLLGLSYLWGDEPLDGRRYAYLFEDRRFDANKPCLANRRTSRSISLSMLRQLDANAASGRPMRRFCARCAAPALNRPKLTE